MSVETRTRKHRTTFKRGEVRRVNVNGREQLSFPLTPLLEKVYQYPEWDRAEYLDADRLHESVGLWSDIPMFVDHPDSFAADTTAEDPDAFEQAIIGRGYAPEIIEHEHDNGETSAKLRINEARIDFDVAKEIGGAVWETVRRIDNGQVVHVSPGYSTVGDQKEHGSYRGEEYSVRQGAIMPDHIALIPPGATGRCTPQEGCAAPRMNAMGAAGDLPPAAEAVTEDANVMTNEDTDDDAQQREHKTVAGVSFTDTAGGKLEELALDAEEHTLSDHYLFGSGDTKSDYSYPVVDAESTLRKGNVAAAHQLGARGGVSADDLVAKLKKLNEQWAEGERPIDFDAKENMLTADDAAAAILGYDVARSDAPADHENAMVSTGDHVRWEDSDGNTHYGIVLSIGGGQNMGGDEARVQVHTQSGSDGGNWTPTDEKKTIKRDKLSVLSDGFPSSKENADPQVGSDTSALIDAYHRLVDAVTSGGGDRSAVASDEHLHTTECTRSGPGGTCSCGLHEREHGENEEQEATPDHEADDSADGDETSAAADDSDVDQNAAETDNEDSTMSDTEDDQNDAQNANDRLQRIAGATEFDVETLEDMSDQQLSVIENGISDDADADADDQDDSDADAQDDGPSRPGGQTTGADSTDDPSAAAGPSDIADAEKVHSALSELQSTVEGMQEQIDQNQDQIGQNQEKIEAPENAKRSAAREHLADQYGVDPESFEGMSDDALAAMAREHGMQFSGGGGQRANGTGVSLSGDGGREHSLPPSMQTGATERRSSPSADMRGRGGDTSGGSDDEETEREHAADSGRGPNGYPKKGREAWKQRAND